MGECGGEMTGIDIRHKMHLQIRLRIGAHGHAHHRWPQIRAPYADIDDIGDALAGIAAPCAGVHGLGEATHPVEHLANCGHDVFTIDP